MSTSLATVLRRSIESMIFRHTFNLLATLTLQKDGLPIGFDVIVSGGMPLSPNAERGQSFEI